MAARVGVILDTHAPDEKTRCDFERAVSMCALWATFWPVGLSSRHLRGWPELFHLTAGRSLAYLVSNLGHSGARGAERIGGWGQAGGRRWTSTSRRSRRWSSDARLGRGARAFVRRLQEGGAAVRVLVVRDREPTLHPDADADWLGESGVVSARHVRERHREL
jgi:hypothetical protein